MTERFVLDCSVAAKWVLAEAESDAAWAWYKRSQAGEISFIAPDLILVEFASLVAKQYRRKLISAKEAERSYALFTEIAPPLIDTRPRLDAALDLSLEFGASLWDCVYITLAMECECPCLTADRRLLRSPVAKRAELRLLR
jgi:predicted nucleic acid-binding protein